MLSVRASNHYISDADITNIVNLYFAELQRLEDLFLAESVSKEMQKKLVEAYRHEICKIISILRNISAQIFISTKIDHVKNYKKISETPEDLKNNFNVFQNIKNMVISEIVNQKSPEHALVSFERWISILKTCHEQNDYFTAGAILFAVNSNSMNKSGLEEKLSPISKSILLYFTCIYTRQDILQSIQVYQHKNNKDVIPVLTALMNAIEKLPEKNAKSELGLRIPYTKMQYRLSCFESYTDISNLPVFKLQERDEELDDIYLISARELKSKLLTKNKKLKSKAYKCIMHSIYTDDDDYYLAKNELNKLCDNLRHCMVKLQDDNYEVCSQIIKILDDYTLNDIKKLECVKLILSSNKNINKSKFSKVVSQLKCLAGKWPLKQALLAPLFDAESAEYNVLDSMSDKVKLTSESGTTNGTKTRLTRSSSCNKLSMDKISQNDMNERYPQSNRVYKESRSEFKHGTLFSSSLHKSTTIILPSISICEASDLMSDSRVTLTNLNSTITTNDKSSLSDTIISATENSLPSIHVLEAKSSNQDNRRWSMPLINSLYDTSTDLLDDEKSRSNTDLGKTRKTTVKHLSSKSRSYSVPMYAGSDESEFSFNETALTGIKANAQLFSPRPSLVKYSTNNVNKRLEPPVVLTNKHGLMAGDSEAKPIISRQVSALITPHVDKPAEDIGEAKSQTIYMQSVALRSTSRKVSTETTLHVDSHKRHSPRGKK